MGQIVVLAARREQLAAPGSVALTAETLALVEGYLQVTRMLRITAARTSGRAPCSG